MYEKKFPSYDCVFWVKIHGYRDFYALKHGDFQKSVFFEDFLRVKREKKNLKTFFTRRFGLKVLGIRVFLPKKTHERV